MKEHKIVYSTNGGIDKSARPDVWQTKLATVYDLAVDVFRGHPFTSVFKDDHRCKADFIESWFVALDFDCGDERASFENLRRHDVVREFASFMYYTPSNDPPVYKSRVVFALARPARSVTEYEEIQKSMAWMFPDSDQATAEAARLFYGSKGRELEPIWSVLPIEVAREFVRHWEWEQPDPLPKLPTVRQEADEVKPGTLEDRADALIQKVKKCADGTKYATLRDIAITFGGYIAGGYYDEGDIIKRLQDAIDTRQVKSRQHAYETIEESLAYGMARPLYFERRVR